MKNRYVYLGMALSAFLASPNSFAYKEGSHEKMSEFAANASVLAQVGKLNDLGLLYAINDKVNQKFPKWDGQGDPLPILDLIKYGASYEDSDPRALNHFFNPLNNSGLTIAGIPLLNTTSPNWALEDNGDATSNIAGQQQFSYKDARSYFYNALTKPAKTDRDKAWGLTFQTLGQVIHHVQDMAQPQHVRNDAHLDAGPEWFYLYNPSLYES